MLLLREVNEALMTKDRKKTKKGMAERERKITLPHSSFTPMKFER